MKRVLVVGGGPAGSLAAVLLARTGVAVTLVEQHRFPRDKVCGECLSALGQRVLIRNGLSRVIAAGVPIPHAELNGTNVRVRLRLPEPMLGISRGVMDAALLTEAANAGAEIMQPARVESVLTESSAVTAHVRRLTDNRIIERTFDLALVAEGRGNFGGRKPSLSDDLGIKAHFTGITAEADTVTLYGGVNGYGGVAPIEARKWNVAFAVPRSVVGGVRGDLEAWWTNVLAVSPTLQAHCRTAVRVTPWLASPLPRHANVYDWPDRIIPIGAAAWAIEPVGGEGMGAALRLAELAAAAILDDNTAALPRAFAGVMRNRGMFCRLGGWLMAGHARSDLMALAGQPVLAEVAMRLIGKSPAATSEASPSAAAGRP